MRRLEFEMKHMHRDLDYTRWSLGSIRDGGLARLGLGAGAKFCSDRHSSPSSLLTFSLPKRFMLAAVCPHHHSPQTSGRRSRYSMPL